MSEPPPTPHARMRAALEKALAALQGLPRHDGLCDEIVGLLLPPACGGAEPGTKCGAPATEWAHSRGRDMDRDDFVRCCPRHAKMVADEHDPEYMECCPSCGCWFGVN